MPITPVPCATESAGEIVIPPIEVELNCATDSITICPGDDPIVIEGEVALDAGTLLALETITVLQGTSPWVVGGTVAITEPVTVDAVDLDVRNLVFAIDKVDVSGSMVSVAEPVTVEGTVALDEASLAALETITVNGVATEVTLDTLLAEFRNKYDVVKTAKDTYTTFGDHTLVAPPTGQSLRVVWIYAQAKAVLDTGVVLVSVTLGTNSYEFELTGSQPFAHGFVWEGAVNEALIVNTSSAAAVLVNADYRSF